MTRQIVLSAAADRDIESIWNHTVEHWSNDQAATYLSGLDRVLHLLADQPQLARERPEIGTGARIHAYRRHLIMVVATADQLHVVRILHAKSDWQRLFV